MIAAPMIPVIALPLTFLFVLLIILMARAPKVAAWIVGSLVLLFPLFVVMFAKTGALRHEEAMPLLALPMTFLFVLMVILLARMPKVGVALIIAIVVMGVLGLLVLVPMLSYRPSAHVANVFNYAGRSATAVVEQRSWGGEQITPPIEPVLPTPPAISPIWSEGLEQEFDADFYPSRRAAARALGLQMAAPIRKTAGDPNTGFEVIVFQEGLDRALAGEFVRSLEKKMPGLKYAVEADLRNVRQGEVGVTLRLDETRKVVNYGDSQPGKGPGVAHVDLESGPVECGRIVGTAFTQANRASVEVEFVEKPWVQDFGAFASTRPNEHYLVARSNETCTSDGEANRQALDDARAQLAERLGKQAQWQAPGLPKPEVTETDVLQGQFVVDKFAQSFAGSVGRIWRQALLIDVSGAKLAKLADLKARESHSVRLSVARMGLSVVGVLVLIGAIYFFLNMATMGYYEWSLRIAGIVLAIVAVISVLMIVR
jgi:hypothetical protein